MVATFEFLRGIQHGFKILSITQGLDYFLLPPLTRRFSVGQELQGSAHIHKPTHNTVHPDNLFQGCATYSSTPLSFSWFTVLHRLLNWLQEHQIPSSSSSISPLPRVVVYESR